MTAIENLFYDNVNLYGENLIPPQKLQELQNKIVAAEQAIQAAIPGESQPLIEMLSNANNEYTLCEDLHYFKRGFSLGVALTMEALCLANNN